MADALDRMASTQGQGDALDRIASKVAGVGKTGVRLKGEPDPNALGDSLVGTLATDMASIPQGVYNAVRHPFQMASGVIQGIRDLPSDLADDIKQGKFGKIGARALELIIPGMGSAKAGELAAAADAAAGRAAARIAASRMPEAIGAEVKNSLTPGIVRRIRERLNPAPSNAPPAAMVDAPAGFDIAPAASTGGVAPGARSPSPGAIPPVSGALPGQTPTPMVTPPEPVPQAPQPFRPNPNIARRMRYGGPAPDNFSPPSPDPSRAGPPSRPLTAPGAASVGDAQKLAAWMKSGSLSQPEAALMDAGDWKLAAQGAGVAEPSAATIKAAMAQLPAAKAASQIKVRRSK